MSKDTVSTEREMLLAALSSLPSLSDQAPDLPTHPKTRELMADKFLAYGFRWHPEEQTQFPIPGDHIEGGYLNLPKEVDRAAYEKYYAERGPKTEAEQLQETAGALLGLLEPKLVHQIQSMPPEQQDAYRETQREKIIATLAQAAELQKQMQKNGSEA
jgi:hypothetical protein